MYSLFSAKSLHFSAICAKITLVRIKKTYNYAKRLFFALPAAIFLRYAIVN